MQIPFNANEVGEFIAHRAYTPNEYTVYSVHF